MIIAMTDLAGRSEALLNQLTQLRVSAGRKVLVLDADEKSPTPGSAAALPNVMSSAFAKQSLNIKLEQQLARYNDIVINAGLHDSLNDRTALIAAQCVLVLVRPEQANVSTHYGLIARLNAARMFNPGLRVLFAAVCDKGDPSPARIDAIRRYTSQVMAAALASTLIHLPTEVAEAAALYNEVFAH